MDVTDRPEWLAIAEAAAEVAAPAAVLVPEPPPWWRVSLDRDVARASDFVSWSLVSSRAKAKPVDRVISRTAAAKIDASLIPRLEEAGVNVWLQAESPAIARFRVDGVEVQEAANRRLRHTALLAEPVRSERNAMAGRLIAYLVRHPRRQYARMLVSTSGARVGIDDLSQRIDDCLASGKVMARVMAEAGTEVIFSSLEITFCEKTQTCHVHKNWLVIEHYLPDAADRTDFYGRLEKIAGGRVQNCGRIDGVTKVVHRDGKTIVERDPSRASDLSRAISYVVKYVCKGDDLLAMPLPTLAKFAAVLEGRHRTQTYGDFRLWSAAVAKARIRYRSIGRTMVPVRMPEVAEREESSTEEPDSQNLVLAPGFARGPDGPEPTVTLINYDPKPEGHRGKERLDFAIWWIQEGGKKWIEDHDAGRRTSSPWATYRQHLASLEPIESPRVFTSSTTARQRGEAAVATSGNPEDPGKASPPGSSDPPPPPFDEVAEAEFFTQSLTDLFQSRQ